MCKFNVFNSESIFLIRVKDLIEIGVQGFPNILMKVFVFESDRPRRLFMLKIRKKLMR